MTILGWILFGLVVGALAKLVMPGGIPAGSSSRYCSVSLAPCWAVSSAARSGSTGKASPLAG